ACLAPGEQGQRRGQGRRQGEGQAARLRRSRQDAPVDEGRRPGDRRGPRGEAEGRRRESADASRSWRVTCFLRMRTESKGGLAAALLGYAGSSYSHLDTMPPITSPTIGATQNSQSEPQASGPPKSAVAVERAGLSEAFDTGIAT